MLALHVIVREKGFRESLALGGRGDREHPALGLARSQWAEAEPHRCLGVWAHVGPKATNQTREQKAPLTGTSTVTGG